MIYHRVKYNGKHINKSDFRLGFDIDLELLSKIHKARITHNKNNSDRKISFKAISNKFLLKED